MVKLFDQPPHTVPSFAFAHNVSEPVPTWYESCPSCAPEMMLSWFADSALPLRRKCPPPPPLFQKSYCVAGLPKGSL